MSDGALAIPADDAELRASAAALAELGARLGGPYAMAASAIRARLDLDPGARLADRDKALVELRLRFFDEGSNNAAAAAIAAALLRYQATAWKHERALLAPPPAAFGTARALLWLAMTQSSGRAIGPRRVRQVLDAHFGNGRPYRLPTAQRMLGTIKNPARSSVNAVPKNFEAVIRELPDFQAAERKATERELAERQAHRDAIARLDAEAEKSWPRQEKAKAEALEKVREAERALRFANDELVRVSAAAASERFAYDHERRRHEEALISGEWPELTEFRECCEREVRETKLKAESREVLRRNARTGRAERVEVANGPSVKARLAAILASQRAAPDLRLVADRRLIPALIARMIAEWPPVAPAGDPNEKGFAA